MRKEKEIKGKIILYEKLLEKPCSLAPFHQAMLRKQVRELKWVLGKGTTITLDERYQKEIELAKKLKKLGL